MATHGASQVATRARRFVLSADDPVPAAKITAPGVPEWAVQRLKLRREHPDWMASLPRDGTCGASCSLKRQARSWLKQAHAA